MTNNFAKLVLDIDDECSLTLADHFDACDNKHTEVYAVEIL